VFKQVSGINFIFDLMEQIVFGGKPQFDVQTIVASGINASRLTRNVDFVL